MKFVKTVDQIAFGNHKLGGFGLASVLLGAAAAVAGVLAVGACAACFCAGGAAGWALSRGGCCLFLVFQKDLMETWGLFFLR